MGCGRGAGSETTLCLEDRAASVAPTVSASLFIGSADCCRQAPEQFAPTFSRTALDCHGYAVDGQRAVCGDDLVHAMRLATGVGLWAIHQIAKSGDCASADVVGRGTADDFAAVVGFVADCDDF